MIRGDTVVALNPQQLKSLNQQIALLSEYKIQCDKTVTQADSLINDYKQNQQSLKELIINKDLELANNQTEIVNLNLIQKKQRKKWIKITLYSSTGTAVMGLITGILIAK